MFPFFVCILPLLTLFTISWVAPESEDHLPPELKSPTMGPATTSPELPVASRLAVENGQRPIAVNTKRREENNATQPRGVVGCPAYPVHASMVRE